MAGRIDYYFLPIAPALPVIADGKLKALAVSPCVGRRSHDHEVVVLAQTGLRYVFE